MLLDDFAGLCVLNFCWFHAGLQGCLSPKVVRGRWGIMGSTLAFAFRLSVMGSNPNTAYFHIAHQPSAS